MIAFCKKFIYTLYIIKLVRTMRKMMRWIKDKAGVSPIIAIILMVAITVVLAATIYVWVSGMGGGGGGAKVALTLRQIDCDDSGSDDGNAGTTDYVIYRVDSVSGGPGWEDIKIKVGDTVVWDGTSTPPGSTWTVEVNGATISSGEISSGDVLKIENVNESKIDVGDTVTVIEIDTGQVIWSADIHY